MNKNLLRAEIRQQRIQLSQKIKKQYTHQINLRLIRLAKKYDAIGLYQAMGSEVSLAEFCRYFRNKKQQIFKPIYFSYTKKMRFVPFYSSQATYKNTKSIKDLDLLFIPLLAIDKHGYRLGQGGGYYDTTLKNLRTRKKPQKIGIGYGFQLIPIIPKETHDIAMNAFVCEKNSIQFRY